MIPKGIYKSIAFKTFRGYIVGWLLAYFSYPIFVYQLHVSLNTSTILSIVIGCVSSLLLAFNCHSRCYVFLFLSQMFSKQGRRIILIYVFILLLNGPSKNTANNIGIFSESLACSQDQIKEIATQLKLAMEQPFIAFKKSFENINETLRHGALLMKRRLLKIKKRISNIVESFESAFNWLNSVVNICNKKLGTPFERCTNAFQSYIDDCDKILGPVGGCSLLYVFKEICHMLETIEPLCKALDYINDSIVDEIKTKLNNFEARIKNMFYVSIKVNHEFKFHGNFSKTPEEIFHKVITDINEKLNGIMKWFIWMNFISFLFLVWFLIRLYLYHKNFMKKDNFDNIYISEYVREIDIRRKHNGLTGILPLKNYEKKIYYQSIFSIKLVRGEKFKLFRATMNLLFPSFGIMLIFCADSFIYWILMQYYILMHGQHLDVPIDSHWTVNVKGNGFLSMIYRKITDAFKWRSPSVKLDPSVCFKIPSTPDYTLYIHISVLMLTCWFTAIFEPYSHRLRQLVLSNYHKDRAKQRATYLVEHILSKRTRYLNFHSLKVLYSPGYVLNYTHDFVIDKILKHFPFLKYCFKDRTGIRCILCAEKCNKNNRCKTDKCIGIYCDPCFANIGGNCIICSRFFSNNRYNSIEDDIDSTSEEEVEDEHGLSSQSFINDLKNDPTKRNEAILLPEFIDCDETTDPDTLIIPDLDEILTMSNLIDEDHNDDLDIPII